MTDRRRRRQQGSLFELLVGPEAYQAVVGRWIMSHGIAGGVGGLALALVVLGLYPGLTGYHPVLLVVFFALMAGYGITVARLFRVHPRLALTAAALTVVANLVVTTALVGPVLSTSVAQGALLVAAVAPVLFPNWTARIVLTLSVGLCGLVFLLEPRSVAPVAREVFLGLQTGVYAGLVVWFARKLFRLARGERRARLATEAGRAELAGADERRRLFLDLMSHELRTPLNAIVGFSEMLALGLGGELNEKQRDYVTDIASSGHHLVELVDEVLAVDPSGTEDQALSACDIGLDEVVRDSLAVCRDEADRREISLTFQSRSATPRIVADERKVKQIVLNLLSNALKFTPPGGAVDVVVNEAEEGFEVSVTDTGIGVDPADRERIFGRFEQGQAGRSGRHGTGLGLAVARRLAQLHGGDVRLVPTHAGPGSRFVMYLPRRPRDHGAEPDAAEPRRRRLRDAFGEPGILDERSALDRLVGDGGLDRLRARFGAVVALFETAGAALLVLLPHPRGFHLSGWPWGVVAGIATGLVLLHPRARLTANQLFVLAVGAVAATIWYTYASGAGLSPTWGTLLLFEGMSVFTIFRLRRAITIGLEAAVGYGLALALQSGNEAALVRWTLMVSLMVSGAMMARWLLRFLPALAEAETEARREAEQVNAALAAASRHKSEFLASMSHELRTPLNAIIGFADVLQSEVFGPLDRAQAGYVSDIESAGRDLLELVNDTLDLAKADAGRLELDVRPCALEEVLAAATVAAHRAARASGVEFSVEFSRPEIEVVADPHRLGRAISCVIDNAVAFTPPGGRVAVVVRERDGVVSLDVYDTGPGIDPADHELIFAAFEQTAGRDRSSRVGIGLALARRLVELHGGRVLLDSAPEEGSVFTIEVPAAPLTSTVLVSETGPQGV